MELDEEKFLDKTSVICFVSGKDGDGEDRYAYVAVPARHIKLFTEMGRQDVFDVERYATVIHCEKGFPSPEIMHKMENVYGFSHDKIILLKATM